MGAVTVTPAENGFVSPLSDSSPSPPRSFSAQALKKKKSVSPHDSQFIQANVRQPFQVPLDSAFDRLKMNSSRPSARYHSTLPLPSPPTSHQLPVDILTLNARSLYNKVDELQEILRLLQNPPAVICVTESWCVTHEPDSLYALQQYSLFRRDRPDRPGGGVLVYVHTSQVSEATRMRELETANEDIWLKVTVYNSPTPLLLCATYRPPTSSATACTAFCSHIEHSIRVAKSLKGHILIAGDMNAKCSDWYRADITDACGESLNITSPNLSLSPHTLTLAN